MKMKSNLFRSVAVVVLCALMLLSASSCKETKPATLLDPKNPVTVTVWNYYNGDQLKAFETLVEEFNSTVGAEKGVVIVTVSQGDINTLATSLISAVNGEAGAQEIPMLAAVYSETAYILNEADALVSFDEFFTEEELSAYIPGFIEEGRFNSEKELMLFPASKSTEIFSANKTDWEPFAAATGIKLEDIKSKEELTAAAKAYYEWTDSLTPDVREDGKALYGRDSVANYIYISTYQLGHEMFKTENGEFKTDLDRETFKTLWDNYYVPYINGYFGSYAKYRSDDCKTGKILALTSSTSSVSYLPTAVTTEADTTYNIETYLSKPLQFKNAVTDAIVQQGASYCLLKTTPVQQEGAVEFLKWFTMAERNLHFALMSGYSPVTLAANTSDAITAAYSGDATTPQGQSVLNSLIISANSFTNNISYATKPFHGSKEVRVILEDSLENITVQDRAAVVAAISAGASHEEAVREYASEEYFNAWFDDLVAQINQAIAK